MCTGIGVGLPFSALSLNFPGLPRARPVSRIWTGFGEFIYNRFSRGERRGGGVFPLCRGGCSNRKTQIPGPGRLDGGDLPVMPRKKRNPFSQAEMSRRNPARMPHGDGQQERCDAGAWRDGDMGGWGGPGGSQGGSGKGLWGVSPPHGCGAGSWWGIPGSSPLWAPQELQEAVALPG